VAVLEFDTEFELNTQPANVELPLVATAPPATPAVLPVNTFRK
jgi:hypothetical protein